MAKKNIYSFINFFLIIFNLKVVKKEFLSLINIKKAQTFYIYKLTTVVVICKVNNLIFSIIQIITPNLKNFKNDSKINVICFISSFS